jgi:hypothetical protein
LEQTARGSEVLQERRRVQEQTEKTLEEQQKSWHGKGKGQCRNKIIMEEKQEKKNQNVECNLH